MLYTVIFLLAISGMALADPFHQCDVGSKPISMEVNNCNEEYCEVRRGEPSAMHLKFKTSGEATKLKATLKAQVAGMWFNWSLGKQGNVCNHMTNQKCPVPANTEATYNIDFTIPSVAPPNAKPTIKLNIEDQDKNVVSCVQFKVLVVA